MPIKNPKTSHLWKIYKVTNGTKSYVGLTSQSLATRLAQHKKAAKKFKNGSAARTKRHFAYTQAFYRDLINGSWRIVLQCYHLVDQVKGGHSKAVKIERAMKRKHETYDGFSQLDT